MAEEEDNPELADLTPKKRRRKRTSTPKKPLTINLETDMHQRIEQESKGQGITKTDYVVRALKNRENQEEDEEEEEGEEEEEEEEEEPNPRYNIFRDYNRGADDMSLTEGERKLIVSDVVDQVERSFDKGIGKTISEVLKSLESLQKNVSDMETGINHKLTEDIGPRIKHIEGSSSQICKNGECSQGELSKVLEEIGGIKESLGGVCEGLECLKNDALTVICPSCTKEFLWKEGLDHCPYCGVPVELDTD